MLQKAFDSYAQQYDEHFTHSAIGKYQRQQVYHYLKQLYFFADKNVLEINCGTGYDANQFYKHHANVTATDLSTEMIAYAKNNYTNTHINFIECAIQNISSISLPNKFDVVFSNFGGLNCLSQSEFVVFEKDLKSITKPTHDLVFVIMGKNCLWEKLYFLLKLDFNKLFRRNNKDGATTNINNEIFITHYYSPKQIKKTFAKNYSVVKTLPIGLFIPPSYLEPWFKNKPKLLSLLNKLDAVFCKFSFFSNLSDHYLIHLKSI